MDTNNSDLNEKSTVNVAEEAKTVETTEHVETEVKENDAVEEVKDTTTESKSVTEEAKTTVEPTTVTSEVKDEKERKVPELLANDNPPLAKEDKTPLEVKYLDIDFVFDCLSVPSYSGAEYRMVTFILMWARANNIKTEFDNYGNIYLTKGELAEGEYYPCVTSHLDTVQTAQELYAQLGIPLKLKERINAKGGHELYVDGMGIGADDKAGILISLTLFKYTDKLKACFFLEEEVGMKGSKELNKDWFNDVAYCIGWDSPDRNRAAYATSGELLFGKDFFELIEETCKEHGVTNFKSEPFTDVCNIRSKTEVVCMNFGNGGYNAHASTEYVIIEDIDAACGLGVALIEKLGTEKFRMKSKRGSYYGTYSGADEDAKYLSNKFEKTTSYRSSSYTGYNSNHSTSTPITNKTTSSTTTFKDEDKVDGKVIEYIVNRYEKGIKEISEKVEAREAKILEGIKELCKKNNISHEEFVKLFTDNPSYEPFSTAVEF